MQEQSGLMPACNDRALMDFGPLLDVSCCSDLKQRHDEVNLQRVGGKKRVERNCEDVAFDADLNKLLDVVIRDGDLSDVKRRQDVENENLKQSRMPITDLEQCQDSSLHLSESFQFADTQLVSSAKHLETSVKSALCGAETSVKMNVGCSAETKSNLPNGNDSSTLLVFQHQVEPALEKGSLEAESSSKKTADDAVLDVEKGSLEAKRSPKKTGDDVDLDMGTGSLEAKRSPKKTRDDAVPDMENTGLLSSESVSDLLNEDSSSSHVVELCQVERVLEKASMETESLPKKTGDDGDLYGENADLLWFEAALEKFAFGDGVQRSYHYNNWIYVPQKLSYTGLSRMFFHDILFTKKSHFPMERGKDGDERWIPPWLLQSKFISVRRSEFSSV